MRRIIDLLIDWARACLSSIHSRVNGRERVRVRTERGKSMAIGLMSDV